MKYAITYFPLFCKFIQNSRSAESASPETHIRQFGLNFIRHSLVPFTFYSFHFITEYIWPHRARARVIVECKYAPAFEPALALPPGEWSTAEQSNTQTRFSALVRILVFSSVASRSRLFRSRKEPIKHKRKRFYVRSRRLQTRRADPTPSPFHLTILVFTPNISLHAVTSSANVSAVMLP